MKQTSNFMLWASTNTESEVAANKSRTEMKSGNIVDIRPSRSAFPVTKRSHISQNSSVIDAFGARSCFASFNFASVVRRLS
jgi:hypothetical protein